MNDELEQLIAEFMSFIEELLVEEEDLDFQGYTYSLVEREVRDLVSNVILYAQDEGIGEP